MMYMKSHNLAKVQHTNLHRTQITNTSKYMMAKLQLAKLKGNLIAGHSISSTFFCTSAVCLLISQKINVKIVGVISLQLGWWK